MKTVIFLSLALLSACGWFRSKTPPPPVLPEIIVTGAPVNSIVFVDDVQKGEETTANDKSQVLSVPEGTHKVDIRVAGRVVYRENLYVKNGEKRVVTVLSGSSRE